MAKNNEDFLDITVNLNVPICSGLRIIGANAIANFSMY